jgi:hypothetical protein
MPWKPKRFYVAVDGRLGDAFVPQLGRSFRQRPAAERFAERALTKAAGCTRVSLVDHKKGPVQNWPRESASCTVKP